MIEHSVNLKFKEGDEIFHTAHPKFGYSPMTVLEVFPTGVIAQHYELDRKVVVPNRDATLATKNRRELLSEIEALKAEAEKKERELFSMLMD